MGWGIALDLRGKTFYLLEKYLPLHRICNTAPVFEEMNENSNQFIFPNPCQIKRGASADALVVFEQSFKNDVELEVEPKSPNILLKRKSTIEEETEEEIKNAGIEMNSFKNEEFEKSNP